MTTRREFLKTAGVCLGAAVPLMLPAMPDFTRSEAPDPPFAFTADWRQSLGLGSLPYLPLGSSDWWLGHYPDGRVVVWKPVEVLSSIPQTMKNASHDEKNQIFWAKNEQMVVELGKIIERRVLWRRRIMSNQLYRFISALTMEVNQACDRWKLYCHLSPGTIQPDELEDIRSIAVAQHRMLREQWNVDETCYPLDPFGPTAS